jgi:hypothetical protein
LDCRHAEADHSKLTAKTSPANRTVYAGGGRFINGSLQVRMTDADIANHGEMPHLNFEQRENPIALGARNAPISNYHAYLPEEPMP